MFKLWKMVVYYKSTYTEWDTEQFFLCVSTLETSFGAKLNVLQFFPLSDFYVVSVMRIIYCFGRVASGHSSVFRYTYSINKRNVIIKATPWLLLYYPLATGRWFYPGPPASSTNITDRHDIAEILLNIFNEVQ